MSHVFDQSFSKGTILDGYDSIQSLFDSDKTDREMKVLLLIAEQEFLSLCNRYPQIDAFYHRNRAISRVISNPEKYMLKYSALLVDYVTWTNQENQATT